ncbi:MAG: hypothetical protein SF172_08860 [Burkholderiales bacterium]|nr:hypothetical protein [Burkholderiales bacterium]
MSRTAQRQHELNSPPVVATLRHANAQPAQQRQVYLLEPHPGTLCRVLDLYAARGIAVSSLRYEHAAPRTMMLTVTASADSECLRVLVAKAGTQFGVIEAAMG